MVNRTSTEEELINGRWAVPSALPLSLYLNGGLFEVVEPIELRLLRVRERALEQPGDNPLREAHARLDACVRGAYGMVDNANSLTFLLDPNLACADKEKAGEKITPPGLPVAAQDYALFRTADCIEASRWGDIQ